MHYRGLVNLCIVINYSFQNASISKDLKHSSLIIEERDSLLFVLLSYEISSFDLPKAFFFLKKGHLKAVHRIISSSKIFGQIKF